MCTWSQTAYTVKMSLRKTRTQNQREGEGTLSEFCKIHIRFKNEIITNHMCTNAIVRKSEYGISSTDHKQKIQLTTYMKSDILLENCDTGSYMCHTSV